MKKIVIIGGGFAGAHAAKKLQRRFDVTLIDTKDYFEFTPGILRTIVEPKHLDSLQIPHAEYLKKTKIIIGSVTKITDASVKLKTKSIPYDYLIISAGSEYATPIKEQEIIMATRGVHLMNAYRSVQTAKNILIVGGGLVGIELAAEFATHCKEKNITLVHAGTTLIERNEPASQRHVALFLKKHGVRIIYGERVQGKKKDTYITNNGTNIQADVAFMCTGSKPNSAFIKGFDSAVNSKNQVIVNDFMQVRGFEHIFAPGDINDSPVEKTAQNASHQAAIAVENIMRIEKGKRLKAYIPKKTPLCISLGKYSGILEWHGLVLTGFIPAVIKWFIEAKEMFSLKW